MTTDDPGRDGWLTLTEAATRTGYSREALRLRVRRGKLRSEKGRNDGQVRVSARDLDDLPPIPDQDDQGDDQVMLAMTKELLTKALDDLRTTRTDLDKLQDDRLVDRGRAERAEAISQSAVERAKDAEGRTTRVEEKLATVEAALAEARLPWLVKVVRAIRG